MGSNCCKQSEIVSTNQESELMDPNDMKIDQEIYPQKVHRGFRNILQKKKLTKQIDEATSLTLLQKELKKYTKRHNCNQTILSSHNEQKQDNLQLKKQRLKSIIKPRPSHYSISSSTRLNTQLKQEENQQRSRQRIRSEKKVRFKIPKQHKKSSHSYSISNNKSRFQINNNSFQTQLGQF
ncbi:unnamed protein product (macronuclear) [Paramecium tetraurelia]|uniref:Chromosome undetermined scaffold_1, whole genome shotgun sequence n=1 Tax=Paramecium tetraurelia TaxID=5888 RepID=Q6BGD1_PARTE|nr:hypothetical protein [Paramecium tetraurelia strain d4-2]XP_001423414.1 uncharacterized protein GSPATT00000451001 [Paramecium tetraurelia]CAH03289.1 hypothetical protein PTMB.92c [Paramecium tetraurelia]CAK56016.1 unnamed protein product [Paramecium tetraurelia]|eukprot:XP_001423414.1 hypothetical protein (macronuclear) [Paramecium tetraurelia strain d4-2]